MKSDDQFDLNQLRLTPEQIAAHAVKVTPAKVRKRRDHFVQIPFTWVERLNGVSGKGCVLALHLTYLHWRNRGKPFALSNGMLEFDGISRASKWRGLVELEDRGLITIERRPSKSPIITVHDTSELRPHQSQTRARILQNLPQG